MKIIKLESEGVKRIKALSITPDGNVIEVTGANGSGKSSTLHSIWYAIAGTAHIPAEPIHRGMERARIRLELGDGAKPELIVTRTFKRKGEHEHTTSVTVENGEGAQFKSPQQRLDALFSALTFDPLEFLRAKPREQFDTLRAFVPGVDFQKLEDEQRGDFTKRSEENRRAEEARAGALLVPIRTDLPDTEIDEKALLTQLTDAAEHNQAIVNENARRVKMAEQSRVDREGASEAMKRAATHRKLAEDAEAQALSLEQQAAARITELAALPAIDSPIDVSAVRAQLEKAQAVNRAISEDAANRRRKAALEKVALDAAMRSDELTAKMKTREKAKQDAIRAAKMPIEGLGFGDGFITLNSLPFDQASSAEQLKASIGIAMRMNSKLKVVLVRDGSLLDADSWKLLSQMAEEHGSQIWVESVFAHSDTALVIEDGALKQSAQEPEAAA